MIEIYADGSSQKNRSGWGFVAVIDGVKVYEKAGTEHVGDTNQRMELIAAIEACDWAYNSKYIQGHDVTIYSDSAYLVNCFKDRWWVNWEHNGWKNSKGVEVANILEWKTLIPFFKIPNFNFEKVKGHSGHVFNERADALAQGKVKDLDVPVKTISLNEVVDDLDLTKQKKYDTINIELSELLLKYRMHNIATKEIINSIIDIMRREGINI